MAARVLFVENEKKKFQFCSARNFSNSGCVLCEYSSLNIHSFIDLFIIIEYVRFSLILFLPNK